MKINKKITLLTISLLILIGIISFPSSTFEKYISERETIATSDLMNQLEQIEKKLAEVRKYKQNLQGAIGSENAKLIQYGTEIANLSQEINIKIASIQELELDIQRLNLEIELMNYQIEQTTASIQGKEKNIAELEEKVTKTLTDMYLNSKSYSYVYMLFDPLNNDTFIKNDLYSKAIQEDTQSNLMKLKTEREQLEQDKIKLNNDKIKLEKDKTLIDEQKIALEKEKTKLDQQKAYLNNKVKASLNAQQQYQLAYENSSAEEQKLLGQQTYLQQQILAQIGTIPSGSYIYAGTILGHEGNTGLSLGPHLHFGVAYNGAIQNPCNFLNCPARTDAQLKWPISPAGTITSGYGQRAYDFHAAIDISTGGNGYILAAHNGWIVYGTQPCWDLSWVRCNGGFAKYAIICENRTNCNIGYKTMYWHLQ